MNLTYDKDQEEAHYHFAVAEVVYYIAQFGVDRVMTDIYDYLEVEKIRFFKDKNKELCFEDE